MMKDKKYLYAAIIIGAFVLIFLIYKEQQRKNNSGQPEKPKDSKLPSGGAGGDGPTVTPTTTSTKKYGGCPAKDRYGWIIESSLDKNYKISLNPTAVKDEVAYLQRFLNSKFDVCLEVDGKAGTNTMNAIKDLLGVGVGYIRLSDIESLIPGGLGSGSTGYTGSW